MHNNINRKNWEKHHNRMRSKELKELSPV